MAARRQSEKPADKVLRTALEKAYAARSKLFYTRIQEEGLDALLAKVEAVRAGNLKWELDKFGVSAAAMKRIQALNIPAHQVFCHPQILQQTPALLRYYRNLAALSHKGLSQLREANTGNREQRWLCLARPLNGILSKIVEDLPSFSVVAARDVMLAEIGTEVQGTWVNLIGSGAAANVRKMIQDFAVRHALCKAVEESAVRVGSKKRRQKALVLVNGWRIVFAAEPDVGIHDASGTLKCAIEIKGSMDRAGAQTRYGEAKKSFQKALRENPRCETIYLASVFTEAVLNQIRDDGQVRKTYNLIDILDDPKQQEVFLNEIFRFIIRLEY